jgi:hypothetical protein
MVIANQSLISLLAEVLTQLGTVHTMLVLGKDEVDARCFRPARTSSATTTA